MVLTQAQELELEKGEPVNVMIGRTRCVIVREDIFRERLETETPTEEDLDLLACRLADMIDDSLDEPLSTFGVAMS